MELLVEAGVGFLAGLLGGLLGLGGSVIIIPGLILYLSQTGGYVGNMQHLLQAAAMICNVFIAAPSTVAHLRARAVMGSVVKRLVPAAIVGVLSGVAVSNSSVFARENGAYLAMLLAGFFVAVAVYNVLRATSKRDLTTEFEPDRKIPAWKILLVGLPMGFTAGLLGIGGGTIGVPAQQILLRIPLRRAIANSSLAIVFIAAVGAINKNLTLPEHGIEISASLKLAAMLIPTAILGGYLGGKLTHIIPRQALRWVFIVFMVVIAYVTFDKAQSALDAAPAPDQVEQPADAEPH
ncbi:MAG: sulfite exporter TauE/SafE family protein [Planctomycetia bacterium]|nr:sulfite exporter TauE/SafE family protein [Planctomycetia bacterium]